MVLPADESLLGLDVVPQLVLEDVLPQRLRDQLLGQVDLLHVLQQNVLQVPLRVDHQLILVVVLR